VFQLCACLRTAELFFALHEKLFFMILSTSSDLHKRINVSLKGLSHEIDFKTFDKNLQNLA
jgi:hypothetical protein